MELFDLLNAEYGARGAQFFRGYARPTTIRFNSLKTTREKGVAELEADGIHCTPVDWYDCAAIADATAETVAGTRLFREGELYLQSLSSMMPPLYLMPAAGESVLDMTAAPGGKTCQLYSLSGGKALITACERDKIRFERLKYNLIRQGATRVTAINQDAAALDPYLRFDKILLDAPCTGSGTATPDTLIKVTEGYLKKCAERQKRLLVKALSLLKTGGKLVYSTCSILKEENGEAIEYVIKNHRAKLVPIEPFSGVETLPAPKGSVCVCPSALYEGFFIAVITK